MFSSKKHEGKYERKKIEEKEKERKSEVKKKRFKVNKLPVYYVLNSFYLFNSFI